MTVLNVQATDAPPKTTDFAVALTPEDDDH